MYDFDYQRPDSVADAVNQLRSDEDAKIVAGGMTLLPSLKLRLAQPTKVLDLSNISELQGIELSGNTLTIGAMTTHAEVSRSADVIESIPALALLAGNIGDAQVRNRGTLGGSIANNDPAADYPAGLVGLGASIKTDRREIPADEFFTGLWLTALEADEVVVSVSFPVPERAGYAKFPNPASRYAIVGVMVAQTGGGTRVAVTGAGAVVFRVTAMEQALQSNFSSTALQGLTISPDELNQDIHASQGYRAHLITVMAKRAVDAAE